MKHAQRHDPLDAQGSPSPARLRVPDEVPDPAESIMTRKPAPWELAALTNVEITERVKRQIRTVTRPWQK